MKIYRMITGPDDSSFCHRVSQALSIGWELHGSASLTFDRANNRLVCGQAITKTVEGVEYAPDMKLGDF